MRASMAVRARNSLVRRLHRGGSRLPLCRAVRPNVHLDAITHFLEIVATRRGDRMGGTGVSSGAENQAAVAAYVAVRMLLDRPLYWTPLTDDIPTALEGEVGGPGDDFQIS